MITLFTLQLKLKEEKKHSVRYDATEREPGITAVYVSKKKLTTPWPAELLLDVRLP